MNENPAGTPNPLNPEPTEAPSNIPNETAQPIQAASTIPEPEMQTIVASETTAVVTEAPADVPPLVDGAAGQMTTTPPLETPNGAPSNIPINNGVAGATNDAAPLETSVAAAVAEMPQLENTASMTTKRKSKTPLIVASAVAACAVLVGIVAAVLLIVNPFGGDRVSIAISKLLNGNASPLVSIEGTINTDYTDDEFLETTSLTVNAGFNNNIGGNYVNSIAEMNLNDGSALGFEASQIYTEDGDTFVKLGTLGANINAQGTDNTSEGTAETAPDSSNATDSSDTANTGSASGGANNMLQMISILNDQWILAATDGETSSATALGGDQSPATCLSVTIPQLSLSLSSVASAYNANPFITSATDNLGIASKGGTLYRLLFDAEKLAGFVNALDDTDAINDVLTCFNAAEYDGEITTSEAAELSSIIPALYVELDSNNNFARVYVNIETEDTDTVADLNIYYPESINIEAPEEYLDMNTAMTKVLTALYGDLTQILPEPTPSE